MQALLMAELARAGSEYAYRLVAPLYEDQGLIVSATPKGETIDVSCRDASGRVTATGVLR
jgi:3-methylfumaryl-CoA hydratase